MFLLGKLGFKFLFNRVRRLRKNINIKMIKIIAKPIITLVAQSLYEGITKTIFIKLKFKIFI